MRGKHWEKAALLLVLLLEVWLFSASRNKFFNNDSLFNVLYAPRSWQSFLHTFTAPDQARQYRPFTLGAMGLLVTQLGTDPRPYHWVPLILHLGNTILLYFLARKLLAGRGIAVIASVTFWGLHAINRSVNYDTTCISDSLACFLLLSSLLLLLAGSRALGSIFNVSGVVLFCAALLTKESAVTFPLAVAICLVLYQLRDDPYPDKRHLAAAVRKAAPVTGACFLLALGFAALLFFLLHTGLLYRQGPGAAYQIGFLGNWSEKIRYLAWAINLTEGLQVEGTGRKTVLATAAMLLVWCLCTLAVMRRRGKLSAVEWSGIIWLTGLNLPALMLANRIAEWYLYVPLLGFSLTFGSLIGSIGSGFRPAKPGIAASVLFALVLAPVLLVARIQTKNYLSSSSASYVSDLYETFLRDFRTAHPRLPPRVSLYFLPMFEKSVAAVLSSPPINHGELYQLYYPKIRFEALFAYNGDRLPPDYATRADIFILQFLDGRLYDVSPYYKSGGKLHAFILPTAEKKAVPLLDLEPAGGRALLARHVSFTEGDSGATLPRDYFKMPDFWILQYLNGHLYDVTDFYKLRRRDSAHRIVQDLKEVRMRVNPAEYYPDYRHFGTPTGAPVFFPTPQKDILTQIGGSEATIPAGLIPPDAVLRFDVSWMYDTGDGGWAEIRLRTSNGEQTLFRRYMEPNPPNRGFEWLPVRVDLRSFAGQKADLVLRCYNDLGKNTISDWLNWRDLAIVF